MVDTFQALAVAMLAILPGALYVFSYERVVGAFGITRSDRILQFLAASAVYHAVASGLTYFFYSRTVASGTLARGEVHALVIEGGALAYVAIPIGAGYLVGKGCAGGKRWATWLVGEGRQPRAWDYLWEQKPTGYIRLRMKSGVWLGGYMGKSRAGRRAYSSGYPEPGDLFIPRSVDVDSTTGRFIPGEGGAPTIRDEGILVRWEEVELLVMGEK